MEIEQSRAWVFEVTMTCEFWHEEQLIKVLLYASLTRITAKRTDLNKNGKSRYGFSGTKQHVFMEQKWT